MQKKCKVKIVGITGYSGRELVKLLLRHPHTEMIAATATSPTEPLSIHHYWPELRGVTDLMVTKEEPGDGGEADVIFLCTPHGVSMSLAPAYLDKGYKVIDLSADFRFNDPEERNGWYEGEHTSPEWCAKAVYGMPELFRDKIKDAQLIANPGCYPTSAILALFPAINEGLIYTNQIHISSVSGATGAGKKPKPHLHHPELDQNFFPYRVGNHQHTPEILSVLQQSTGKNVSACFVPHLLPIQRGILTTIFCQKDSSAVSLQRIHEAYTFAYSDEPFVRVLPLGEAPTLHAVQHTNFVDIGLFESQNTAELIIISAEDNLIKGASGTAVQNMNLISGFNETTALL